jgi:hypothetical protein
MFDSIHDIVYKVIDASEDIRNINGLFVSFYSIICMANYHMYNHPFILNTNINFIWYQCIIDLFFSRDWDVLLHHSIVLCAIFSYGNLEKLPTYMIDAGLALIQTEFSTVFYIVRIWILPNIRKHKIYTNEQVLYYADIINNLLFFVSFFYLRVYSIAKYILFNGYMFDYHSRNGYILVFYIVLSYGFYYLNLYWFTLMIKKIVKIFCSILKINYKPEILPFKAKKTITHNTYLQLYLINSCITSLFFGFFIRDLYFWNITVIYLFVLTLCYKCKPFYCLNYIMFYILWVFHLVFTVRYGYIYLWDNYLIGVVNM